jgi:extracellular elastinolytic metalloproteinase
VRLAWVLQLTAPGDGGEWEVVIATDSATATLLDSRKTTSHACSCRLSEFNPDVARRDIEVPLDRSAYPVVSRGPQSPSFAFQWLAANATEGNNVVCYRHNSDKTLIGDAGASGLCFHLPDAQSRSESQQLLNAFYWCNWLHDFFLLLGFDEEAGNFQAQSPAGLGSNGDRLVVRVFEKGFAGIASMRSRADGKSPEMKLGSRAGKPSALDAEIVVHEFVHGVTNRLIGGRSQSDPLLGRQQSEAMGEGYSDYFALTIVNHLRVGRAVAENWAYGAWIANDAAKGLRNHAYDGPLGTANDLGKNMHKDAHDAGQVWGKALIETQKVLWRHLGRMPGDALGWQLVVDSLKLLTPKGRWPNLIDGRDALHEAFDDVRVAGGVAGNADLISTEIRRVFSDLMLGETARSDGGAQYKDLRPGP